MELTDKLYSMLEKELNNYRLTLLKAMADGNGELCKFITISQDEYSDECCCFYIVDNSVFQIEGKTSVYTISHINTILGRIKKEVGTI